jgi:hypothetical protein
VNWKYSEEFGGRSALLPHRLTYAFSLRVDYELAGLEPDPNNGLEHGQCAALIGVGTDNQKVKPVSHHVQGAQSVATLLGSPIVVPRLHLIRGHGTVLVDDAYTVPFEGRLLLRTDESELLAVKHTGKLAIPGGTQNLLQSGYSGNVFLVLQTDTASLRFRWMVVNQLVAVGKVSFAEKKLTIDMDCLIAA